MPEKLTSEELKKVRQALDAWVSIDRIKASIQRIRQKAPTEEVVTTEEVTVQAPEWKITEEVTQVEGVIPAGRTVPKITETLSTITWWTVLWWAAETVAWWVEEFISEPLTKFAEKSKVAADFLTSKATWEEWVKEGWLNVLKNVLPWLAKEWAEAIDSVANPIDTLQWMTDLAQWLTDKLVFWILDTVTWQKTRTQSEQTQLIDSVGKEIGEKYWTPTKLWKAFQENPAVLLTIAFSAIKKSWRIKLSDAQKGKVEKLSEEASVLTDQFLKPTKDKTTRLAEKVWPEMLERWIEWTRKDVLADAKAQLADFWKQIEEIRKADGIKWEMKKSDLLDILDEAAERESIFLNELSRKPKDKLTPQEVDIISGQEAKAKAMEAIADQIWNMDAVIPLDKLDRVKKAFDQVLNGTDASLDSFQNSLRVELANKIRSEISKSNPSLAGVNKEFSFYKWLETVLEETLRREKGKFEWGWIESKRSWRLRAAWAWLGWATWAAAGWFAWAALWILIWREIADKIDSVLSSPKFKIVSANRKKKLADAISNWDKQAIEKILDVIIVNQAIQLPQQDEETVGTTTKKVDFFNR